MNISVIGSADPTSEGYENAKEIGEKLAKMGFFLICGGLGGVMEAAAAGAKAFGGITIGILPGFDLKNVNSFITIPIVTAMADARNVIIVRSADIVVAVEGGYGTLSEIAIALKIGKPVIGLRTWKKINGVYEAKSVNDVIKRIQKIIVKNNDR